MNDVERRNLIREETINFLVEQISTGVHSKSKQNAARKVKKEDICKSGEVIDGRFQILHKVCDGGFGQVFKAQDEHTNTEIALKIEPIGKTNSNHEGSILKQLQGLAHFPKYYRRGMFTDYTFIAMQLLGKNLMELRRMCRLKFQRLSTSASVRVAMQCLTAIESLHEIGYLHRDVKPSNFAIGGIVEDQHIVYMLDFGLCRYYLTSENEVKTPRPTVGFRGTVRYASLNTHFAKEISRRDDLLSWFYSFYELTTGQLPWRKTNDREVVSQLKSKFTPKVLSEHMPIGTELIAGHIGTLKYESTPDYDRLSEFLHHILIGIHGQRDDVYDWMINDCTSLSHWN